MPLPTIDMSFELNEALYKRLQAALENQHKTWSHDKLISTAIALFLELDEVENA